MVVVSRTFKQSPLPTTFTNGPGAAARIRVRSPFKRRSMSGSIARTSPVVRSVSDGADALPVTASGESSAAAGRIALPTSVAGASHCPSELIEACGPSMKTVIGFPVRSFMIPR